MTLITISVVVLAFCSLIGTIVNIFTMVDNRYFLVASLRKNMETLRNNNSILEKTLNEYHKENVELKRLLEVR